MFTKTLVKRLDQVIYKLIHPDQTSLVKNRLASDNARRLLHIIHAAPNKYSLPAILSIDA